MKFILALLILLGLAAPAGAAVCWPQDRDAFAADLMARQGQFAVFIGAETGAGATSAWTLEIHAAPGGGSWTAFAWSGESGQICLLARGPRWSADKEI